MTALVVSIQPLGGPSFGDYHHRQQQQQQHEHDDEEDNDETGHVVQEVLVDETNASTQESNHNRNYSYSHPSVDAAPAPAPPPLSPMDGMPRSCYSLDEEEVAVDVEADDNDMVLVQAEDDTSTLPILRAQSHDSEGSYVVVDRINDDDDDDSLPSLNDMEDVVKTDQVAVEQQQQEELVPLLLAASTDNVMEDEGEAVAAPSTSNCTTTTTPQLPFGGLNNLGNTCYLNSALQMVASLDDFSQQIQEHIPAAEIAAAAAAVVEEKEESAASSSTTEAETLRQALVSVLERLAHGETFSPDAFKSKVDERSPLFIGYRQQDAHEFLTTLLDLVDEDYKKKDEPPQPPAVDDEEMKVDDNDKVSSCCCSTSHDDVVGTNSLEQDDQQMLDGAASPVKKQRLDQGHPHEAESAVPEVNDIPSLVTSQSFKDLQFADIENLLHGDGAAAAKGSRCAAAEKEEGLKCKLVGGRMSTSGAALTRWDEENNMAASPNSVKPMAEDDNDVDGESSPAPEEEQKPFSPVDDYFTTQVRVCLTCDSCKYRRSHTETYLHLSLEIGPSIGSIEEGLRSFFKPEKREIKCEKCFCETALQTTEITKLPRALLFHLKRFIVDISPDYTSISYRKDQSPVSFEPHLELDEHSGALSEVVAIDEIILPKNSRYGIRSVVNHIGSSASCGHYTADAFRVMKDDEDNLVRDKREWLRFNDSYVSKISQAEAVDNAASTAYMVLYELEAME